MEKTYDLDRFIPAHVRDYPAALREIRSGRKRSHWMWCIFPQLRGLGFSSTASYYGIEDLEEAKAYLAHPVLGADLREICQALLELDTGDPSAVMGYPDDLKLRSSMTLFYRAGGEALFMEVLEKFYSGREDGRTLALLGLN